MSGVQIELLQFRFSPYNEKVRWALDLKRVPHARRSLLPGPHMATVRKLTGRTQTPVLVAGGEAIDQSARILAWLEQRFPEPALYPSNAAERAEAGRIERWFDDEIAPRGRRAIIAVLLETPGYFARVFGAGKGAVKRLGYAATVPLARKLVEKGNGITGPDSVADGLRAYEEGLAFVAGRIAKTGYLAGDRFSIADLTAASALATAVDVTGSPMARPQPMPAPLRAFLARFAGHAGAQWVRSIYAMHRGATDDFEGPSR